MGIFVNLDIFPERIDAQAWRSAYEETLRLLQAWPSGILGLREEKIGVHKRLTYSRLIEHHQENWTKRYWKVEGDQQSCHFGETHELFADLHHYERSTEVIARDEPSLLSNLENRHGAGRTVFDAKSQGFPYHIALLAVAMLMEDTFPGAALASGDITLSQARKAQQSIRELLGREVALPIGVDGVRLLREYVRQKGPETGLQRFFHAYCGDDEDAIRVAADEVEPTLLHQCYAIRLTQRPEPDTLGFHKLCQIWMNATADLPALISMACLHEAGPRMDAVSLAEALVGIWLTASPATIRFLAERSTPRPESPTIDDLWHETMLRLAGLQGLNTRVHLGVDSLLAAFQERFPDRIEEIRQAVTRKHEKILDELQEIDQEFGKLMPGKPEVQPSTPSPVSDMTARSDIQPSAPLPDELVAILDQCADPMELGVRRLVESAPELAAQGPDQIRTLIYMVSRQRHMALTERAWGWIDMENDDRTLLIVLFLISIQDDRLVFTELRKTLLESPGALAALRSRMG